MALLARNQSGERLQGTFQTYSEVSGPSSEGKVRIAVDAHQGTLSIDLNRRGWDHRHDVLVRVCRAAR